MALINFKLIITYLFFLEEIITYPNAMIRKDKKKKSGSRFLILAVNWVSNKGAIMPVLTKDSFGRLILIVPRKFFFFFFNLFVGFIDHWAITRYMNHVPCTKAMWACFRYKRTFLCE